MLWEAPQGQPSCGLRCPQLEAEAKRMRQNLGVDGQQPLVQLIRTLA
jgi:hypothetical protein